MDWVAMLRAILVLSAAEDQWRRLPRLGSISAMVEPLSLAEVDRIARLARLALTDVERRTYALQLARILEYARQIEALNTTGIEPTASLLDQPLAERQDEPRPSLPLDAVTALAPEGIDGLVAVPRVLGGE